MMILQKKSGRRSSWLGAAAVSLLASLGCVVGPKYHAPAPPQAPAAVYKESPTVKETGDWTVAQPADAKLRGKWWEIFNDAELNSLEEQLDINNQNIKQYFENFMEARAIVREARSQYFPTLTAAPSVTHSRSSANLGVSATSASGTGSTTTSTTIPQLQSTLYSLPFEASW
jgi:outer membrane protein TolC